MALVRKFGLSMEEQEAYAKKILKRFANAYLGDTTGRVAHDPKRKLSPQLYFSHPISMALEHGVEVNYLATAVAAALSYRSDDDAQSAELAAMIEKQGVADTVREVCKIEDVDVLNLIVERYNSGIF